MKKIGYPLFCAAFLLLCFLPAALTPFFAADGTAENRTLSDAPALVEDGALNLEFGEDFETWLSEHFAGREQLVSLRARALQTAFATAAEDDVVIGRAGWLFYTPTVADFLGTEPLTQRELYALAATQRLMQEYVERQGGQYLCTVAPNKNSLYGQYMPWYMRPAAAGSALQALPAAMQSQGVAYVDLYGVLQTQAGETQLYHKRDTHWNNEGALLACQTLLAALDHPANTYTKTGVTLDWRGDLDRLLYPVNGTADEQVNYDPAPTSLFRYDGPANVELARVRTSAEDGTGSLLLFRDSFGNALLPFMAGAYADATFLKATPYDLTVMEPGQTVITEIVERNLRVWLQAAPLLPAPERDAAAPDLNLDLANAQTAEHAATLYTAESGDYTQFYGALDPAVVTDDADIYLLVESAQGVTVYEAFPCGETDSGAVSGYGYSLRIATGDLPQGDYTVTPALHSGSGTIKVTIK